MRSPAKLHLARQRGRVALTLLLCPSCQTPLLGDPLFCQRCGPDKPTLITSDEPTPYLGPGDPDVARRLVKALGTQFEVRRLLGRGGFADVFEVWDTELQRRLAVKVLRPDIAWTSGMLARFKQEARAIARLSHPNTVPIHFVGEGEGIVYYAMPYVEGQSLAHLLRATGALDPERVVALARPILEALEYAHQHGIVHRDIKPDNVMLETATGRVLLLDFGIAKWVDGSTPGEQQTHSGFIFGTPQYMSPEQALGQGDIDHRTDIYAVGAMLFQMATGAPPFEGDTSQEIVGKHLSLPAPAPTARNAKIPRWFSDAVVRCLAKRPGDRFQSAAALLQGLTQGQEAGPQDQITVARVANQIQSALANGGTDSGQTPAPSAGAVYKRARLWPWLVAGGVSASAVFALIAVPLFPSPPPKFTLENRFLEPIKVALNGRSLRTVAAGESLQIDIAKGKPLEVTWELVRPLSVTGNPLGESVTGSIVADKPTTDIRDHAEARSGNQVYFAPVIANGTGEQLQITVLDDDSSTVACDCAVPVNGRGIRIGYYRLLPTTSIRAIDPKGGMATITDLLGKIDSLSGELMVRFDSTHLQQPELPKKPAPGVRAAKREPVPVFNPLQEAAPEPEWVPVTPPDTVPAKPPRKVPPNPLQGIFPPR